MMSVPSYTRSFSCAVSSMLYGLLGSCLSPVLSGVLMDVIDGQAGLLAGFRLVLWWSVLAILFLGLALTRAHREPPKESVLSGAEDLSREDVSYEMARRRIHSCSF